MEEKVVGRSGEYVDGDGNPEFWWNGRNYGCILPEELIDAVMVASEKDKLGEKEYE